MSVSAFGVTAATVRSNRFRTSGQLRHRHGAVGCDGGQLHQPAPAYLEGKLLLEAIVASSISDSASAAYLWCQETLG